MRLSDRDHLDLFGRLPHLKEGEDLQRTGMGESRRGAEAMRPAHLHHAPQPRGVALARDDEQLAAARQEARQARERLVDVILRDARLVEARILGGRRSLCSNDAAHPLSAANLRPGATSSSAHACDMNASTWPSSAFVDRAASNGRGVDASNGRGCRACSRRRRPTWRPSTTPTPRQSRRTLVLGIQRTDGDGAEQARGARQHGGGVCPPHRLATAAARCSSVSPCLPSAPRRRPSAPRRRSVGRMADATKMSGRTR